ncbi:hypothetical protein IIK97_004072 [Salmonella enterica subsp. enterica serovar Nigeria]|nr:hypothetical protein [Salmonella enterica subsp. enterica serovar Nigeria]
MAIIPMSYSANTIIREYRKIGETSIKERGVDILLHNDGDQAVAIYAEPEDIDGQLRHIVLSQVDMKTRRSTDENETIMAVIDYYESQLVSGEPVQVEGVTTLKHQRGASLATSLYEAIVKQGIILVSDNVQFPGGKALWQRIARYSRDVAVFVLDPQARAFWPYDGDRVKYDGLSIPEDQIWSLAPDESRKGVVLVAEQPSR